MKKYDVEFEGETIRCEWHTKIELHRNRIYFAFGDFLPGKILIGIFTHHVTL